MESILPYLLQSTVSIILLYAIYRLFLERDTFFAVNRIYLTASIVFSLLFPLFRWNVSIGSDSPAYVYLLQTITITPDMVNEAVTAHLPFLKIITVVYLTGAALFFIRFIYQLIQVSLLIMKYGISHEHGLKLVFIDRHYQPFSFFKLVFIPASLRQAELLPQIIEHEKVHMRQVHSVDLVLLEILTIIQWFNPVIWLYRRSLKSVHEYLADQGVLTRGFDRTGYQELLMNQSLGIQVNDMTNNFNHSLLKNRIMMMTKARSKQLNRWKAAMALPVVMGLVIMFSTSVNLSMAQEEPKKAQTGVKQDPPPPPPPSPSSDNFIISDGESIVYTVVENPPEFKGGRSGLIAYMIENVKYPEEAKRNGVTGTVFVSFLVTSTGKVTKPVVLRGVDPQLDAEALRVVKNMPDWIPGRIDDGKAVNVQFNLPVKFALDDKPKTEEK
jgi:TonB family protein